MKDVFGLPVPRVTYREHRFEVEARKFYLPFMRKLLESAGAERIFLAPGETTLRRPPPPTRHGMGTLRMGEHPASSVVNPDGRFHDVDNLFAGDGSIFPTASGYNPTLTIIALALRIGHGMAAG